VWLYPLRSGAKAVRITGVADRALAQVAPAIAMDERGGVGAYRIDGALSLVFVDAGGGLAAPPVEIDRGEVGAPALAVAEGRALVTWAKRASAKDPYVLHWMLLDLAARDIPAARTWATAGGAFAPTVVTDGTHAVIAWMEGDDGKRGKILVARTRLDRAEALDGIPVSLDTEGNARDPEIAGPASAPTVVYAVFTKQRPGGVARLARVTCGG
jgi:hypothetical protein